MESVGNFSHTLEEFTSMDEASEFMLDKATEDAQEEFIVHKLEVPLHEWEMALENALSSYSIEGWEVRND
jgi:hypothetical protein